MRLPLPGPKLLSLSMAILTLAIPLSLPAQSPVTFQVDMCVKMLEGRFRPDLGDVVVVPGGFNDWSPSPTDTLSDLDGDSVYSGTVTLADATTYEYKFRKTQRGGEQWEGDPNRVYTTTSGAQVVPPARFNRDSVVGVQVPVTIRVDMRPQIRQGRFRPDLGDQVAIPSSMESWDPADVVCTDPDLDSIFTRSLIAWRLERHQYTFHKTDRDGVSWETMPIRTLIVPYAGGTAPLRNFNDEWFSGPSADVSARDNGSPVTVELVFGHLAAATRCLDNDLGESELPPPPPPGSMFDARFIDSPVGTDCIGAGIVIDYHTWYATPVNDTFKLQLNNTVSATLSWSPWLAMDYADLTLNDLTGGSVVNVDMLTETTYVVPLAIGNTVRLIGTPHPRSTPDPPAAPALLLPSNGAGNMSLAPTFSWDPAAGASSYQLQVSASSLFSPSLFDDAEITGTSRQAAGLAPNTIYYWRVRAAGSGGSGVYSAARSFTTAALPEAPTLLSPSDGALSQSLSPTLSWNASSGAASYRLQLSPDAGFETIVLDDSAVAGTARPLTDLAASATYYWRVSATGPRGSSPSSETWSFTTGVAPLPGFSIAINVVDNDSPSWASLVFGQHREASYCVDGALGEWSLPPVPPFFEARFVESRPGSNCLDGGLSINYHFWPDTPQPDTFRVRFSNTTSARVSWRQGLSAHYSSLTMRDRVTGTLVNVNMLVDTAYTIAADIFTTVDIVGTPVPYGVPSTVRSIAVRERWNLVSVPYLVGEYSASALFAGATSPAYAYAAGYHTASVLQNGSGYWMKFAEADSVTMSGSDLLTDTVAVSEGWNLVGSLSVPIPASSIASIPGGIVTSNFFAYGGSYGASTMIEPGRGYWVKSSEAGMLIMAAAPTASPSARIRIEETGERPPAPPGNDIATTASAPLRYSLDQNYPNPFNGTTIARYVLPGASTVHLALYDVLGREVRAILVGEEIREGLHAASIDAGELPSGVYLLRITAIPSAELPGASREAFRASRKLVLMR